MTFEEVQREYDLTLEDVGAALKFVTDTLRRNPITNCLSRSRTWVCIGR